jgi:hypothetical protein
MSRNIKRTPLFSNIAQDLAAPDLIREFSINSTLTSDQKASASDSVISFGTYNGACRTICVNREVALKVSVQYTEDIFNNLRESTDFNVKHRVLKQRTLGFETNVYKHLTDINPRPNFNEWYNITPYVTRLIFAGLNFDQMAEQLNQLGGRQRAKQDLIEAVRVLYVNWTGLTGIEPNALLILVTEKEANVSTLLGYLTELVQIRYEHLDYILKNIVLQGLMGIININNRGITHNDMHMSNLLVEYNPNEAEVYYMHNDLKFKVDAKVSRRLLFFDWDNAHCAGCGQNLFINDLCRDHGVCDILNMKYDIYVFLVTLKHAVPSDLVPEFTRFFRQIRLDRRNDPPSIFAGAEWRLSVPRQMTLEQFKERLDSIVPDVEILLQNDFFQQLRIV